MITKEVQTTIIQEICSFIGSQRPPPLLVDNLWIELDSGIWLVSKEQNEFIQKVLSEELFKKIKYAGIYLGKIRKNFGLSMEVLYLLQPYITRYAIIKGKTLQKYLYGKSVTLQVEKNNIQNFEPQKLIIMTPAKEPVGISSFKILEEIKEENNINLKLQLDPITVLGMFLRNVRSMFD